MTIGQRGMGRMITFRLLLVLFAALSVVQAPRAVSAAPGLPPAALPPAYRIGPGDILAITVWKNDNLSRVVPVLPDGRVSLPLLGEITAAGKTVSELQAELTKKWKEYAANPVVTVTVNQVNSFLIYIIGKVNSPGRFQLNSQTSVLQALAMASGLNPFAQGDEIKIFRRRQGKMVIYPFDLDKVEKGVSLNQNILLMPGDVIVVP